MSSNIRLRLFVMMVLEFVIWGAWLPLIYGYLPSLGFSPSEQSWILNAFPISAILGIFFSNQFADRNFAAEKFLSIQPSGERSGGAGSGLHAVVLAVFPANVRALPALRADAVDRQLDRLRPYQGPAKGVRTGSNGRNDRMGACGVAIHLHPGGLGQGRTRPTRRGGRAGWGPSWDRG